MRRLISLLSMLAVVTTFGVACSDPLAPESCVGEQCAVSQDGLPSGSNNSVAVNFDGLPSGSNN